MPGPKLTTFDHYLRDTYHLPALTLYQLSRDGHPVMVGTEIEIIRYIHDHHPYSLMHALNHEGYRLVPTTSASPPASL